MRNRHRCLLGARTSRVSHPQPAEAASFVCLTHLDLAPWRLAQCPRGPPTTQGDRSGEGCSSPEISVDARDDTPSRPRSVNWRLTCNDLHRRRSQSPTYKEKLQ